MKNQILSFVVMSALGTACGGVALQPAPEGDGADAYVVDDAGDATVAEIAADAGDAADANAAVIPHADAGISCVGTSECPYHWECLVLNEGCGAPGRCAPPQPFCTSDSVPYCGCDGVTFFASSNCPQRIYARTGACATP